MRGPPPKANLPFNKKENQLKGESGSRMRGMKGQKYSPLSFHWYYSLEMLSKRELVRPDF